MIDAGYRHGVRAGRPRRSGTESSQSRRWRKADSNPRSHSYESFCRGAAEGRSDIPRGMRHGVRRSIALSPARLAIPWSRARIRFDGWRFAALLELLGVLLVFRRSPSPAWVS